MIQYFFFILSTINMPGDFIVYCGLISFYYHNYTLLFFPKAARDSFLLSSLQYHTLEDNEEAEHTAGGDILPPGAVQTTGYDDLLDRGKCHRTEEGTDNASDTTGKKCSADDGRCNGVHFHTCRIGCISCAGMHHKCVTCDTAEETADHIA